MDKQGINNVLKRRVEAARQASELSASDQAYEKLFQAPPPPASSQFQDIPIELMVPFFTADIGFKPYPKSKLQMFSQQLQEEGLLVRVIVRRIPGSAKYEILSGHNRTESARLAGWTHIPAEIVEADDDRAVVIATSTNLLQRQNLTPIERGKAYKALLDAKNRQGYRSDRQIGTSGENRQKYSARALVAEFFGVTEYEIRKAIKLSLLIPQLQQIMEDTPKRLNLSCAEMIADYDAAAQEAFVEMYSIADYQLNKATIQRIMKKCPPPSAKRGDLYAAWREARAEIERKPVGRPKTIRFDRRRFEPFLSNVLSDKQLEDLFYEFLKTRLAQKQK